MVHDYTVNNSILTRTSSIRDLGVLFTSNFNFTQHIINICSSASRTLGFIIRICRPFHDILALKSLYFAFVVSKLEYASLIWYPYYASQALHLDRVQRRFLNYASFKLDNIYPGRDVDSQSLLERHDIMSLASRRIFSSARYMWMLIHNKIDAPFILARVPFHVPRLSSRQGRTFHLPTARTDVYLRSPVYIMCLNAEKVFADVFMSHESAYQCVQ